MLICDTKINQAYAIIHSFDCAICPVIFYDEKSDPIPLKNITPLHSNTPLQDSTP